LREQGLDIVGLVDAHKSEAPYNSSISETVDIKVNNFEFDLSMVSYVTVWYNLKIERINYELAAEEDSIYIIETGTEWVDDEWNIYNFDASAFNGSRFSYSGRMYPYHPYFTDSQYQGNIEVGWDETSQSITDFSFEVFNGSGELVHKISGINLPFGYYGIWPALTVNGVFGETSCAYINEFEQKSAIYNPTNGAVLNHLPKFKSYRCDANSWISVLFHAEGGNVLLSKRFPLRN
jgi:hypothetical protein